jgi:hypothetical protein
VAPRRVTDEPYRTSDVPSRNVDRTGAAAAWPGAEMETLTWMTAVCLMGVIVLLFDAPAPR